MILGISIGISWHDLMIEDGAEGQRDSQ